MTITTQAALALKIDASAAKEGARDFTAAVASVKAAVLDLAKDSDGAFISLKKLKPQFDVTPITRGSAAARDLTTAMDTAGRASTTVGTASQRAGLAAAMAMRQASTSAQKLAFRLGDLGQTAALDQLDAALDRLHAQLRAAPDLQGVRVARSAYEDLRTELTQAATAAEYAKGDLAQLAREQASAAQAAARHSASLDALRAEFNPLYAASKAYESSLERIALAEKEGVISAQLATRARQQASAALGGFTTAGKSAQAFGFQVQNASYQIADFAVQVGGGVAASRAMAQQLPQLLGGFGVWGAAAGAVAAIMGALIPVLMSGGEKAKTFDSVVSDLNSTLTTYRDSAAAVNGGTLALREEFGLAAESAQKFQMAMAAVSAMKMEQQLRDGVASLSTTLGGVTELMNQWDNATYLPAALRPETLQLTADATARLQSEFGLTLNSARLLTDALSGAQMARGPEETSAAMQRVVAVLLAARDAGAKLPPELATAVEEAATLGLTADRLAAILAPMPDMIGEATGQTNSWASSLGGVRSEIEAIMSSLSAIGGGVISNSAKRSELMALNAGASVKEAEISRRTYEFELRMTAETNSANARGGVAGWLGNQAVKMQRYQFNEGLSLDAQFDSSREAARKRDSASAGGGGSSARTAGLQAESATVAELNAQMQTRIASMDRENAALSLLASGQATTAEGAALMAAAMSANGGTLDSATASTIRLYEAQVKLQDRLQADVTNTTAESLKRLGESAQQTLESSLQAAFMGDFDFGNMVDSLRSALAQTLAQQTAAMITNFLSGIGGGMGGGGGGLLSFVGSIFGFSAGGYSDRPGMTSHMVSPAAFRNAPQFKAGTTNTSGIPAILHPNEAVVPLSKGRKIPVDASGLETGGGTFANVSQSWGDINVAVTTSGSISDPAEASRAAEQIADLVKLKVQEQLAEQSAYGGVLNPRGGR